MEMIENNLSEKGRRILLKKRSFFNLKEQFILDLNREKKKKIYRGEKKIRESYLRKLKFRKKDLEGMLNKNQSAPEIIEVVEKGFLEEELRSFENSEHERKFSQRFPFVIIFSFFYFFCVLVFCLNFHRLLISGLR